MRETKDLIGFTGVCCANCGRVLPHRVAKENPLKQLQPMEGPKEREEGLWLEVLPCKTCNKDA